MRVNCCSGQPTCVTIKLYPATGESSDEKWVCLTLQLQLPDDVFIGNIFDVFVLLNFWPSRDVAVICIINSIILSVGFDV